MLEFMESGIVILFGLASFLASALLFSVQPMIGKMVLPVFGGTPAVWNTCLVFFQGTLLCGYLVAYGAGRTRCDGPRRISDFYLAGLRRSAGRRLRHAADRARGRRRSADLRSGGNPALVLLGVLCGSAALPLVHGLGDRTPRAGLVCPDRSSRGRRSLLSVCREQCGQPAGALGLSIS